MSSGRGRDPALGGRIGLGYSGGAAERFPRRRACQSCAGSSSQSGSSRSIAPRLGGSGGNVAPTRTRRSPQQQPERRPRPPRMPARGDDHDLPCADPPDVVQSVRGVARRRPGVGVDNDLGGRALSRRPPSARASDCVPGHAGPAGEDDDVGVRADRSPLGRRALRRSGGSRRGRRPSSRARR